MPTAQEILDVLVDASNDLISASLDTVAAANVATAQADIAVDAKAAAIAAAAGSGISVWYDTKALADAALGGLTEGQVIGVFADETKDGAQITYRVEGGILVEKMDAADRIREATVTINRTNGQPRTFAERFNDGVNLADFKTPGTSDWTTAITRALTVADEISHLFPGTSGDEFNGSFASIRGPMIVLPEGNTTLDAASLNIASRIKLAGEDRYSTSLTLPADEYLFDSTDNPLGIVLEDLTMFGGKGAFIARNDAAFGRGMYELHRVNFQGFTEAAFANLSVDFGRIIAKGCFFWAAGTVADGDLEGIGLALRGIPDNSLIEGNFFHKVRYGAKIGSGTSVAWLRNNSFLRPAEATGGMTDIWIVPAEVPGDVPGGGTGRGLQITDNRHGNEGIGDGDFRILVADGDVGSGDSFASQGHSSAASTGRVDGVIAERNYVGGGDSVTRPYVYSFVPKMKGWVLANQLENVPGELGYAPGLTYDKSDFFQGANRISTKYSGIDIRNKAPTLLGDAAFMWQIDDPLGYYAGVPSVPHAFPGAGFDTNFVELKNPLVSSGGSSGAPVATPQTDTYGGQHRVSIAFAGDDTDLTGAHRYYWTLPTVFTEDHVGKLAWFEFDIMRAAALPLDTIAFTVRSAAGNRLSRFLTVPAKMKTVRIPFIVNTAESCSMNFHPVGWVSGEKTGVIIERPRAYLASEPVNQGHAKAPSSDWDKAHLVVGSHHYFHDNLSHPRVKIGGAPTSQTDGFHMALRVTPPATATSPGTQGQWSDDGAYFYLCTGTNIWKRVAIAGW